MAEQTATQPDQDSEDTQSGADDATSEAPEAQDAQGQQDAAAEWAAAETQHTAQGQRDDDAQATSQSPAAPPSGKPEAGQQAEGRPDRPRGVQIKLTQEQTDRLLKDGTLELSDEHFTGAVRDRIGLRVAAALPERDGYRRGGPEHRDQ